MKKPTLRLTFITSISKLFNGHSPSFVFTRESEHLISKQVKNLDVSKDITDLYGVCDTLLMANSTQQDPKTERSDSGKQILSDQSWRLKGSSNKIALTIHKGKITRASCSRSDPAAFISFRDRRLDRSIHCTTALSHSKWMKYVVGRT